MKRSSSCPARLSPIKGHSVLIEALAHVQPRFDKITAVILGDEQGRHDYRRELESLIAARNLEANVKLTAHCSDMPAAYKLASLVVAPSLVPEGFGRVPVEAMSMGGNAYHCIRPRRLCRNHPSGRNRLAWKAAG